MTDALTKAAIEAHREWLGFVQPEGLAVAPPIADLELRPAAAVVSID